jgi:Flp pilus assembly pilin Flp
MKMKNAIKAFMKDESGLGTIELVLLVIILVGLAVLFKTKIGEFFTGITSGLNPVDTVKDLKF